MELNREGWLTEIARQVAPEFKALGLLKKRYRVTCGWPCREGLGLTRYRAGECHGVETSSDGTAEIFINPRLDKPLEVAGTLCHELAHVVAGTKAAHGKGFVAVCQTMGLTRGKPRQVMPGERLNHVLAKIVDGLGPYPHRAIVPVLKEKVKRASTVVKMLCACGCRVTMPVKWLAEAGAPTCGCGQPMVPQLKEEEDED